MKLKKIIKKGGEEKQKIHAGARSDKSADSSAEAPLGGSSGDKKGEENEPWGAVG